jgi:SsrA-binding protein
MQIIARNKKALHNYEIIEKVVAGIVLSGSEVKSIRAGKISLADSYASCSNGEMFINHMHIAPYGHTNSFSPDTYRKRKLLLNKKQIYRYYGEMEKKHLTMVPLMVYFDRQWIKVELGLGKGLKKYDNR